jgi:hypothetical protein
VRCRISFVVDFASGEVERCEVGRILGDVTTKQLGEMLGVRPLT